MLSAQTAGVFKTKDKLLITICVSNPDEKEVRGTLRVELIDAKGRSVGTSQQAVRQSDKAASYRFELPLTGRRSVAYWSADWRERTELLDRVVAYLNERRWGKSLDSGWSDGDLEVHCHPWTTVQVCTAQEDHGSGKRLIRVRYRLRLSAFTKVLAAADKPA